MYFTVEIRSNSFKCTLADKFCHVPGCVEFNIHEVIRDVSIQKSGNSHHDRGIPCSLCVCILVYMES